MSLQGLPPLPKSLSGFLPTDSSPITSTAMRGTTGRLSTDFQPSPTSLAHSKGKTIVEQNFRISGIGSSGRKSNSVDTKLAILRQEMYTLRQLDLSLLAQLWSLNESIQECRQALQEQDDRILLVPSPTQSSGDDADGDDFFTSTTSLNFRLAAPPPPVARRPSTSSNASR